jgi:hypothetical protein
MTVWIDLLAALPAGASEAVATVGIAKLLERFRRDFGNADPLVHDLEAVARNEDVDLSRLIHALSAASARDGRLQLKMTGDDASAQQVGQNSGLIIQNLSIANPTHPSER